MPACLTFPLMWSRGRPLGYWGRRAGKSTALSLLMGFIRPDDGEVSIRGMDCFSQHHLLMQDIGFVPRDGVPARTTGDRFIRLLSIARGIPTASVCRS